MVLVNLYGKARELAGRESVSLDCPSGGLTLSELLRRITPGAAPPPAGAASAILINGRNCAFLPVSYTHLTLPTIYSV